MAPFITAIQAARGPVSSGSTPSSRLAYNALASPPLAVSDQSPIAQPLPPSMHPSIHHPSSTLRLGTPLNAAFIPLVPEASSGRSGVFSQTSDPAVMAAAMSIP